GVDVLEMISAFEQSRPVRLIDPVEAVAAQPTPHRLAEAPALVLTAAGLPTDLATFRQGLDHLAPVRPGLVSFEPNQGNLPSMDYPFDRLVIANQLIRDQRTTIIFQHLGFSRMSRWPARSCDLD